MEINGFSSEHDRSYENAFYWFSHPNRIAKLISHYEIYKSILPVPGDILEFGVYKAASLIRWASFRETLENAHVRKIIGFDSFGKFPISNDASKEDIDFVEKFSTAGGDGLSLQTTEALMRQKSFENVELIEGDVTSTLPDYLAKNQHLKISLLHMDLDVYDPTIFVMNQLWDRISPGGLIVIDDYNLVEGATKAVDEFLEQKKLLGRLKRNPYYCIPIILQK